MILGSVSGSNYYKGVAANATNSLPVPSPLVKVGEIESQRWEHQWELLQPYDATGKPNEEFVQAYPEESEKYGFLKGRDYQD